MVSSGQSFLCTKYENNPHNICIYARNCVYLHRNSMRTLRVGEKDFYDLMGTGLSSEVNGFV